MEGLNNTQARSLNISWDIHITRWGELITEVLALIERRFIVLDHHKESSMGDDEDRIEIDIYRVAPQDPSSIERSFKELYREVISMGYYPQLISIDGNYYLRIYNIGKRRSYNPLTIVILLLASIATVTITSYMWYSQDLEIARRFGIETESLRLGTIYVAILALSILGPLAIHELGHFLTSRILRLPATPPYFIPGPPGIGLGTFGAVILMRFLPATADDLAMVAIAGPLAGFAAILIVTIYGISTSYMIPSSMAASFQEISFSPLLFTLMVNTLVNPGQDEVVILNPVAYAGYFLMLIHFLNLLPVAQLDGGQVLRSLVSMRTHMMIGVTISIAMIVAAMFLRAEILITIAFFLLIIFLATGMRSHPGPAYREAKPGLGAAIAAILWIIMLAMTIPLPL